jgi:hypothetical protein
MDLARSAGNMGGIGVPDYLMPDSPVKVGLKSDPQWLRIVPENGSSSTYRAGDQIRFQLPSDSVYDMRTACLAFNATATQTAGTFIRFPNFMGVIIAQLRVLAGSKEIVNIQNWGLLMNIIRIATSDAEVAGTEQAMLQGVNPAGTRNTDNTAIRKYLLPMYLNLCGLKPFPTKCIKDVITFEFTLATNNAVIEGDGTPGTLAYSITNTRLHVKDMQLPQDWVARYLSMLSTNPYTLTTHAWQYQGNTLSSGTSSFDVQINIKAKSIKSIFWVMRTQSTLNDPTVNDKWETFNPNSISNYYVKINGKQYPAEPIDCTFGVEPYLYFLKAIGVYSTIRGAKNAATAIGRDWFTNKAIFIWNLESHQHAALLDGLNTTMGNVTLSVTLNFSAPLATNQQMDIFVEYDEIVKVRNGLVEYFL